MKFVPNYTVSYHGEFHKAGITFDIEDKDADEMSAHGVVSVEKTKDDTPTEAVSEQEKESHAADEATDKTQNNDDQTEDNKPKRGRSKKQEESNDTD